MRYRVFSIILSLCFLVALSGESFAATDIKGHWAQSQIDDWTGTGLISGYKDGSFRPNNMITRAEFITLVNKAFKKKDTTAIVVFSDVKPSDWFHKEVSIAVSSGYVSGYADGEFKPYKIVSREEAAAIIERVLNLKASSGTSIFKDSTTFPSWSKNAINSVVAQHIMVGYLDGTFKAMNGLTRAEALVTLDRASMIQRGVKFENTPTSTVAAYVYNYKTSDSAGYFFMKKIEPKANNTLYQTSFYIPGTVGTVKYVDRNKNIIETPLKEGYLPSEMVLHVQTDQYYMILGQGYTYRNLGSGTIDSLGKKPIKVSKQAGKWLITYNYELNRGSFGILWGIASNKELVNFRDHNQVHIWSGYDLNLNARLGFGGYYYKSPSSYTPYTPNSYWRIPSAYLTNSLIKTGGSLAADIMGNALLSISKHTVIDKGYIPSLPKSNWLATDYRIGGGFFDTRFNADTIETFLVAYQKFKNPEYRDVYLKMADYYLEHAENHKFSIVNAQGVEGWLVEDYSDKNNYGTKTHVSLNHQLQAIHIFLLLYLEEKDQRYLDCANKMLYGIKNTRDKWIMQDNNLEYAFMNDGSMGLVDYPYLTYNDLYHVQADLVKVNGVRDADLDKLMTAKKIWMDNNKITGYKK